MQYPDFDKEEEIFKCNVLIESSQTKIDSLMIEHESLLRKMNELNKSIAFYKKQIKDVTGFKKEFERM